MDKRKAANQRVKRCITDALFSLMREKSLSDIRITELIARAGVARASFYRNYRAKEDVLVTLIRDVLDQFSEEIRMDQGTFYTYENILLGFQYFQRNREYVLNLYHSGFASVLLEELNCFHEALEGSMLAASVGKYALYMYIGALFNTALVWLTEEPETPPETLAAFFMKHISDISPARESSEIAEAHGQDVLVRAQKNQISADQDSRREQ